MGNPQVESIVRERGSEYGDAWKITSDAIRFFAPHMAEIHTTHFIFAWVMILNKLIRALFTPFNEEHWVDIQGYAQLVRDELSTYPTVQGAHSGTPDPTDSGSPRYNK